MFFFFLYNFSDKNMDGDEGLRTLECLRGRLLAERATSKAANDESEQISQKVFFFFTLKKCLCVCFLTKNMILKMGFENLEKCR